MPLGGIVLSGGLSSARFAQGTGALRLRDDAPGGVVRQLAVVAEPILVVAGRDQPLPELPPAVEILRHRQPGIGPLEGLRTGLAALQGRCQTVYLTGCDSPLLVPAFVRRLQELLGEQDIAVPQINGVLEPLAAIYRVRLLALVEQILASGRAGPSELTRRASTRIVTADELRQVDPDLDTLMDIDQPQDYQAALSAGAGLAGQTTLPQPERFRS